MSHNMNNLITFFMIFPLLTIIGHLIISKHKPLQRYFQMLATFLWLILTLFLYFSHHGIVVIAVGQWVPPFGISLVFDKLSSFMLVIFAIVINCVNAYSYQDKHLQRHRTSYYCGFWLLLLGVSGAVCTGDLFNLYVWSELMLISSFILLTCTSRTTSFSTSRYAIINIFGTLIMLMSIALIYGLTGTLNYADIAQYFQSHHNPLTLPVMALFLFAIAIKGGLFPLYFWLPSAYPKPSYSATMLLSSLSTKVTMVVLLRLMLLWSPLKHTLFEPILVIVAMGTMFFGVMGAANQFRLREILSFHIISQIGYIFLAILLPSSLAVVPMLFFLIHNIFVKTNLFMVAGLIEQQYGTDDLKQLGHLFSNNKLLASLFFIAAMSLAGIPPLSGFWAKLLLIKATLAAHFYLSAAVAIIVSLFTLYSMIKIWRYVFSEVAHHPTHEASSVSITGGRLLMVLPLFLIPILMGIFPDYFLKVFHGISQQMLPMNYIHAVLGVSL